MLLFEFFNALRHCLLSFFWNNIFWLLNICLFSFYLSQNFCFLNLFSSFNTFNMSLLSYTFRIFNYFFAASFSLKSYVLAFSASSLAHLASLVAFSHSIFGFSANSFCTLVYALASSAQPLALF